MPFALGFLVGGSHGGSDCKFCSLCFHQNDEKVIVCGHGAASENSCGRSHSEHLAQRAGGMGSKLLTDISCIFTAALLPPLRDKAKTKPSSVATSTAGPSGMIPFYCILWECFIVPTEKPRMNALFLFHFTKCRLKAGQEVIVVKTKYCDRRGIK